MGLQAEGQQNQAARPRFSCTPPLFSHRPPLGFHRAPRPAVVRQGGAFPWVQSPTMLCRRRGLDLRDVWPTPQLPVSKKKQSQKRLWWCVEEAPCQGRAGGEGSCCARRAIAGAPGRCHRPVTGGVCLPHGCFPGGKTAAAWTRPAPGGPAGPGSSAQCGLPARTRGAPPPCCALGPEGGGGPGARDGRQRRGAPGSPSAWVYPRTHEIATRPDARVAPSPGVPPPPRRQARPRPPWREAGGGRREAGGGRREAGGGGGGRSLGRVITPVPNIPNSCFFRPGRKPGWGGCAGPGWRGDGCRPFWGESEPLCHLPCARLQVPSAESRAVGTGATPYCAEAGHTPRLHGTPEGPSQVTRVSDAPQTHRSGCIT